MPDIKSMGLYRGVDRILADLEAAGVASDQPLAVGDLTPFDQYHYEGTSAVDDAARLLGADDGSIILDVGSGLGGPARYLADQYGSQVVALELQQDLHETGVALTERCGLEDLVRHVHGDVLADQVPADSFTGLMTMLCFLHIPERSSLFAQCSQALRPAGAIFVDDYFQLAPFTASQQAALADKVFCSYLPDIDTYVADVQTAGFIDVQVEDKTADWTQFVADRTNEFQASRAELEGRYGGEMVDSLGDFYSTVAGLFATGSLGGLRLTARKP